MRIAIVLTLAAVLTIGLAAEAAAQRIPSGAPRVDMGAPSNRGIAGQDTPWSGPPDVKRKPRDRGNRYFAPTERPFQGSAARRWQRELNRRWGGLPADRFTPRVERRFGFPGVHRQQRIFVEPQPWPIIECFGTRCRRTFPPVR